jgi:hypothetical protein
MSLSRADPSLQAAVDWLLEPDAKNPGVRFFALRDLLDSAADDAEVIAARAAIMQTGPVPKILAQQQPEGYWVRPGAAYSTKYRGTPWQLIQLDRLGADPKDPRVRAACEYELQHGQAATGGFSSFGGKSVGPPPPSLVIHCLHGNLLAALINLGYLDDERVQNAIAWQTNSITGEDPAFAYYASGTSGPGFACVSNRWLPCAWGANKALRALLAVPESRRTPAVERALQTGAEFLLSSDPALADYPRTGGISDHWWRLGTLFGYTSDVLETLENLVTLGYGADPRLDDAFQLVLAKRDSDWRWRLEGTLNGRTWTQVEQKGAPSKWVTLRALRALRRAGRLPEGA